MMKIHVSKIKHCTLTTILLLAAILTTTAFSFTSRALADIQSVKDTSPSTDNCGVPVCDLQKELDRFNGMTQSQRFASVSEYRKNYKSSTDLPALKNISELAESLVNLFQQIHEEDWLIREAIGLQADCLLSLARYSELDAAVIAGYYARLSGESTRYEILIHWREKINQYEDKDPLLKLQDLFGRMAEISLQAGDPEYLAREARGAQEKVTTRLLVLYPYFEGVYEINVSCTATTSNGSSPTYCRDHFLNRLVLMDTQGSENLQVFLVNNETSLEVLRFSNVLIQNGDTFDAVGTPDGALAQLHLVMNRELSTLSGWVRSTDGFTVTISGKRIFSPAMIFDNQQQDPNEAPVPAEILNRTFQGTLSGRPATLTFGVLDANRIGATLILGAIGPKLRFQSVRLFPKIGVLVLLGSQSNGSWVKGVLSVKIRAGKPVQLVGATYSTTNGSVHTLDLMEAR